MNILLVGNGFIGKNIISKHYTKHNFTVLSVFHSDRINGVAYFDVSPDGSFDKSIFKDQDIIIYTAYDLKAENNFTQLKNMYVLASEYGIKKIIYFGTLSIYRLYNGIINEKSPKQDICEKYAKTKLRLDKYVKQLAKQFNIKTVVMNPTIVLGEGSAWNKYIVDSLTKGNVILPNNGEGVANIIMINDLCSILMDTLSYDPKDSSDEFLLSSGCAVTWKNLYQTYKETLAENGIKTGDVIPIQDMNKYSRSFKDKILYNLLYTSIAYNILNIKEKFSKSKSMAVIDRKITFSDTNYRNINTEPKGIYRLQHICKQIVDISHIKEVTDVSIDFSECSRTLDAIKQDLLRQINNAKN
jgi:nucleoside-diphosphate-sugar epimerase